MKDILTIAFRVAIAVKETHPIPLLRLFRTVGNAPNLHELLPAMCKEFWESPKDPDIFNTIEDYDLSDPITLLDQVFQDIGQSK